MAEFGVSPVAGPAWDRLRDALAHAADRGQRPACANEPEAWWPEHGSQGREAIEACGHCPFLGLCEDFATANTERFGVWAGRLRTDRNRASSEANQKERKH